MKIIRFVLLFSSVILFFPTQAQTDKEQELYDSLSYHYYKISQWDSVIDIGKESIYKGYDFYALRMRMGNAYNYQDNYRLSEKQFTKALEFKPENANAAFYQYQSAINGGRQDVAYHNYKSYNKEQKALIIGEGKTQTNPKLPVKLKGLEQISILTSYSFTGNKNNTNEILPKEPGNLFSSTNIRNNQFCSSLGLKGNVSESLTWKLAYSYKNIESSNLLRFYLEDIFSNKSITNQHELFGDIAIWSGKGTSFHFFGQYLDHSSKTTYLLIDTLFFAESGGNDSTIIPNASFSAYSKENKGNAYIWGIKINKSIDILDVAGFGTYSNIREAMQLGGEFTILPKGNYALYLTNRLTFYKENDNHKFIYKVIAGGQLFKDLKFITSATFGDLQYTNESDYGIVYNLSEETSFKAEAGLSYSISKKIFLNLNYQLMQKKEDIYVTQIIEEIEIGDSFFDPKFKLSIDQYQFNEHFVYLGFVWYL